MIGTGVTIKQHCLLRNALTQQTAYVTRFARTKARTQLCETQLYAYTQLQLNYN